MALSKEQQEQLAELERLRDEPDEPDDDDTGGDDGHVIVLRGSRADSFLSELLGTGTGKSPAKAKAGAPPAGKSSGRTAPVRTGGKPPAKPVETDDDDDPDPEPDPAPPRANRYFR
jgi:hypothetical protein